MGHLLGEGAEGYVFEIKNKRGLVVKITESRKEYTFFKYLKRLGKKAPLFFPRVKKVFYKSTNSSYPYIIIREDVADMSKRVWRNLSTDFENLCATGDDDWKTVRFYSHRKKWFQHVRKWCLQHGWTMDDLHDENVGIRNRMPVIRDLGFASRDEQSTT